MMWGVLFYMYVIVKMLLDLFYLSSSNDFYGKLVFVPELVGPVMGTPHLSQWQLE